MPTGRGPWRSASAHQLLVRRSSPARGGGAFPLSGRSSSSWRSPLTYAVIDLVRNPDPWEAVTYLAELLVPPIALVLARGPLRRHVEGVVLAADFALHRRPRRAAHDSDDDGVRHRALPRPQDARDVAALPVASACSSTSSAAITMLAYYLALVVSGRAITETSPVGRPDSRRRPRLRRRDAGATAPAARAGSRASTSWPSEQRTRVAARGRAHPPADRARDHACSPICRTVLDRVNSLTADGAALRLLHHLSDRRRAAEQAAAWPPTPSEPALRAQILAIETPARYAGDARAARRAHRRHQRPAPQQAWFDRRPSSCATTSSAWR